MALSLTKMIRFDLSGLLVPAGVGPLLQNHPIVRGVGGELHIQEHNEIHYDTPALQLYRHHGAITLNRRGEQWIQWCIMEEGAEQEKKELETAVADQELDLRAIRKVVSASILNNNDIRTLAPVFTLHCREQRWPLHFPAGTSMLLREERGYLKFGATRHPFHELVLEFQSGDLARWFQTGLELAYTLFLQEKSGVPDKGGPGLVSLTPAARGFAWLDPSLLMPTIPLSQDSKFVGSSEEGMAEAMAPILEPEMTARQAFVALCGNLLQQMQTLHSTVLYGGKQARLEGIRLLHQYMARLHALFVLYHALLPKEIAPELDKEFGWLLKELALVQECQSLLKETLEPLTEQFSTHPGLEELLLKTKNGLILAVKRLEKALTSFRYVRLVLGLENWLTGNHWEFLSDSVQREGLEVPVVRLAADWLQQCHGQLRKQGRHWSGMSLTARCALHNDVDQLVHATDLFADLFANKRSKQAGARSSFQECLGRVHNNIHMLLHLHTSSRFLTRGVNSKEGSSEPHPIQAWQEARIQRHLLEGNREWEQFASKLSYWY
ncbi:MAG: CHAD domain-containing protein [Magnetococcales bacterium]|nr:CHAD domain-containing protein [Magnetococcales bacterium]